jgi:hypothetical protein
VLSVTQLGEYIDARLSRSAFRLELLDHYDVGSDGQDLARFLRGDPAPSFERKRAWLDRLRRERAAGILNQRVHVLSAPLTDYLRYECEWGYVLNARAGEEIYIVDTSEQPMPAIAVDHDFWLIDDLHAIAMSYDSSGRYRCAEPVDAAGLPAYRQARDELLAAAEPFTAWWSRHPQEWREHHAA